MSPKHFVDNLLGVLFPWYDAYLVTQVAGEVARECRADLWNRVQLRLANMSIAQIRGYVRAYAAGCVGLEVRQAAARRNLRHGLFARVEKAAIDQLVGMIARDVLSGELSYSQKSLAA